MNIQNLLTKEIIESIIKIELRQSNNNPEKSLVDRICLHIQTLCDIESGDNAGFYFSDNDVETIKGVSSFADGMKGMIEMFWGYYQYELSTYRRFIDENFPAEYSIRARHNVNYLEECLEMKFSIRYTSRGVICLDNTDYDLSIELPKVKRDDYVIDYNGVNQPYSVICSTITSVIENIDKAYGIASEDGEKTLKDSGFEGYDN